jgi:drug/metabolite transporter (DMT)-like permease
MLLAACIWGFAFGFQRQATQHLSTYSIVAIRFAIGALCLLPFVLAGLRRPGSSWKVRLVAVAAGAVLFAGASFQQWGLVDTTAGKAGFITGLYVVIVPLLGLLRRQMPGRGCWAGVTLAVTGLYFLSVTEDMTFAPGDAKVLVGAVIWAMHVQLVGWLSPRSSPVRLACTQYAVCAVLGGSGVLLAGEPLTAGAVSGCMTSLLYLGVVSTACGFTLQVMGQREAPPAHAAIILSLETVFAALAGWILLNEVLSPRALVGCALMMAGMLTAQLWRKTE